MNNWVHEAFLGRLADSSYWSDFDKSSEMLWQDKYMLIQSHRIATWKQRADYHDSSADLTAATAFFTIYTSCHAYLVDIMKIFWVTRPVFDFCESYQRTSGNSRKTNFYWFVKWVWIFNTDWNPLIVVDMTQVIITDAFIKRIFHPNFCLPCKYGKIKITHGYLCSCCLIHNSLTMQQYSQTLKHAPQDSMHG